MGAAYNHAVEMWKYINAHKDTGVSGAMFQERFGKSLCAVMPIMEYYGFLCYLEKGRLYPYRVAEKEPPKKSIENYFTRWLDNDAERYCKKEVME